MPQWHVQIVLHFVLLKICRAEDEIFFVYDTTVLQREEDEIKDAILCFYPSVVGVKVQGNLSSKDTVMRGHLTFTATLQGCLMVLLQCPCHLY